MRSDRCLVGIVLRTHHDFHSHEPLEDILIIAHAPLPTVVIQSFVTNGAPPKGYIFVEWAQEQYGHSLVAEQDVVLLDRPLTIGDTVKRVIGDSGMVGTVVHVHDSWVLEPIARVTNRGLEFTQHDDLDIAIGTGDRNLSNALPEAISHSRPETLLRGIPSNELRRADDFVEGDNVVWRDWIGVIEDCDLEVVLLLENNTVVAVVDPEELELIIPEFNKPFITLPDTEGIRRPDVVASNAGGLISTPPRYLVRGQSVITNKKNIRNGRWLHGGFQENCVPRGHILDVRTSHVHVQWLCPNAFADQAASSQPPSHVRCYENLPTFTNPQELRRNKSLTLYDRFRLPAWSPSQDVWPPVSAGQDFEVGDSVRFRVRSPATLKYQGDRHGRFERVPKEAAHGFDLNEFTIVCSSRSVTVQWQDQTKTTEVSTALNIHSLPEAELVPGDLVTLKEGMQQIAVGKPDQTAVEFNEMLYFQDDFRLRPKKIGVIQSVNSKERLARIRLFADPEVELLEQGNVLRAGSRLGTISDIYEEVSMYEIMAHPALLHRRRDLVILPPERPSVDVLRALQSNRSSCQLGPSTLSYLRSLKPDSKFEHLRNIAKHFVQSGRDLQYSGMPDTAGQPAHDLSRPLDWIGEIVDLGADGFLTVRLGGLGADECHDIKVPFERILMILDDDAQLDDGSSAMSTEEPWSGTRSDSDLDSESAIDEEVVYEGGERLDDGSDDDWMTDDEVQPKAAGVLHFENMQGTSLYANVEADAPSVNAGVPSTNQAHLPSWPTKGLTYLQQLRGIEEPDSFVILDTEPPEDHFAFTSDKAPELSATFLRRVNREHRILSTSLPAHAVYVRTYESRLDLMRCLIVGPADTPYEHVPLIFDLQFGPKFPTEPPAAHFHSWTGGLGRINPNLYEEGKICLSLLNTWPGQSEGESWSEKASILQVLISLMGLVLVKQPFYNEAGFDAYDEEKLYTLESQQYSEKAFVMARGFVKHALNNPPVGLEDVLAYLYLPPSGSSSSSQAADRDIQFLTADEEIDEHVGWNATLPGLPSLQLLNRSDASEKPSEATASFSSSLGLLCKVIGRSTLLINRSEALRGTDGGVVDGAGRSGDDTKTFLKPLSRGAVVMLRKTVNSLIELQTWLKGPGATDGLAANGSSSKVDDMMLRTDTDMDMTA